MSVADAAGGIYQAAQLMLRRMREDLFKECAQDVLVLGTSPIPAVPTTQEPPRTAASPVIEPQTLIADQAVNHLPELQVASPPILPARAKRSRFDVTPDQVVVHRLPRSSRAAEIPSNVLAGIFSYLLDPHNARRQSASASTGHFTALTYASHVCTSWRRVAHSSPELWSDLHTLSTNELENLDTLLRRSYPRPIRRLAIDFVTARASDFGKPCAAISWHMDRIEDLQLTMSNRQKNIFFALKGALVESMAPRLKRFSIDIDLKIVFSGNLFSGTAPFLSHIALHSPQVPRTDRNMGLICRAFRAVKRVELLDDLFAPKYEALQLLYFHCPQLEDLTMRVPLIGSPGNDTRWSPPALQKLKIGEASEGTGSYGEGPEVLMLRTLDLLQHRHIVNLEVVTPHPDTVRKVLGLLPPPSHLTVLTGRDAGYIAIEASVGGTSFTRTLSRIRPAEIEPILRFIVMQSGWITNLSSLSLGFYAQSEEWDYLAEVLGGGSLPSVSQLTLHFPFVIPPHDDSFTPLSIFDYTNRRSIDASWKWNFPGLKKLFLVPQTSTNVIEPHWKRRVDASAWALAASKPSKAEVRTFSEKILVMGGSMALTVVPVYWAGYIPGPEQ